MGKCQSSSSLTDKKWVLIEPAKKKRKLVLRSGSKRQILDGVLYQLKNGCNWSDLPQDLPPYSTVFWQLHSVERIRGNGED
ncbi:transposase [Okeania hirsuta]|uniref:transposase n=1 Tax=Okeania hirsuta TaxID=1458930 RepID=UPI00195FEDCC